MKNNNNPYFLRGISKLFVAVTSIMVILPVSVNALEFPSAPERNPPKSTAAGGRRGGCVQGDLPIKAITPGDDNKIKTISSQPPFYIYIPKTKADSAQFLIKSEDGTQLDFQEIAIENGDYIIEINLSDQINITEGQTYTWEISLVCNPMFINSGNYTKGTIERVSLDELTQTQLEMTGDTLDKAQIFANADIWTETLINVIAVKESQPQEWIELLTSVGLHDYAEKSFATN
ncbi:DUF928 domain-containing protein [Cyanobacterium aponinum AL20118]|uniref:DUF928 domain-containing protein n=3 Tax=Cyanobacterium aponinum TaxID=379064 RepID=K9Z0L3_CYAAP|nr:DUF928 domain-containing protein [Cyanobacterium aponinum]AFZ52262.1 protein of unknown function DUF928 [Cyanobacterium aponinum PCC 10605]MTF38093.1 DUF928 domain-containing protein [Cyanobacterium aponinum 0216]PHV63066.1 DUF928 domain-containing protein [Cyanobacterium aponinum IPPAS B-1201]WPF88803.1 DUF928 domain-containing protein [Cyanobacterium aponinum AL20115]WRL39523.1 DUF928 domain-containing protein [Cyanobacterium aponinum UTEX 3221]